MDYLFTPWRYHFVTTAGKTPGCLFCDVIAANDDKKGYVVYRGRHCFVMLNAFPYTSGHVMIVPYAHVDELRKLDTAGADEMMAIAQKVETALRSLYSPDGLNLGMNIGKAAGAGIAAHIHMHALPRWFGDTNFMTVVSETRVLPESLDATYHRIKKALA
jgi:ATP adenylyltransferase